MIVGHPVLLGFLLSLTALGARAQSAGPGAGLVLCGTGRGPLPLLQGSQGGHAHPVAVGVFQEARRRDEQARFWTALYVEGQKFAEWFAKTIVESIGRAALDATLGAPPRPAPGQPVINSQPPSTGQGIHNLLTGLSGEQGPGPGAGARVGGSINWWNPLHPINWPTTAPVANISVTVNAGAGADGKQIGEDLGPVLRTQLDRWFDETFGNVLSEAQAATNR
jgi:hypothetical protein